LLVAVSKNANVLLHYPLGVINEMVFIIVFQAKILINLYPNVSLSLSKTI